jgi:hypothetical protein
MSIDERDRRNAAGREGVQRAPRSGGRTTEQRSTQDTGRRTPTGKLGSDGSAGGARGARHYPTQGSAALKLNTMEPVRDTETVPRLRVAPPAPISVPRAPFVALVIGLVVAGVFGILMINTKTNENSFQISRLQEQQSALDNQQQQLEKQIATYGQPGNLRAAARKQGLVGGGTPAYIRLPDGKVIGVPKPADGQLAITAQDTGATRGSAADQGAGTAPATGR